MITTSAPWIRLGLAGALAACLVACGGESESGAGAAPAAPPSEAPRDKAAALESLYEWDASAGATRDLAADAAECQSQVKTEGLAGVAQHIQCMQQKGWKARQPAS
jgi:hypothetical protein